MNKNKNPLINSLLAISQLLAGIVGLLMVGTFVAIYLVWPRHPTVTANELAVSSLDQVSTRQEAPLPRNVEEATLAQYEDTGLAEGAGLAVVKANCLGCHSAKLVTQNRFTRDGWHKKIVWMQQTQGLWELGENEPIILDYLAEHYAPEARASRRQPLTGIKWYELKSE